MLFRSRRSMLGFLGLGSVAGPAVVKQLDWNQTPMQMTQGSSGYYPDAIKASPAVMDKDYVKRMQEELSFINADPLKWIADRVGQDMKDYMMGYSGVSYQNIDPDIRNMRSITEVAKMRMYYERRAKRQFEVQKESLSHRIAEALGFNTK